jgi:predicted transcriptional regulator
LSAERTCGRFAVKGYLAGRRPPLLFFFVGNPSCAILCTGEHRMTETLSIRLDIGTKRRLGLLAKRSRRSKSFLAAEAIAAYVEAEEWQLREIQAGLDELDAGRAVSHERVSGWLRSWGAQGETRAPR